MIYYNNMHKCELCTYKDKYSILNTYFSCYCSTYVEWVEEKASELHTQQVPLEDFFPLFTLFHFCQKFDSLAFVSCFFKCLLLLIMFGLFWTCKWNIQWRWFLYIYIFCGLLPCDSSPVCKRCCHVCAHHYNFNDDSKCAIDYELSSLPKGFPYWTYAKTKYTTLSVLGSHFRIWQHLGAVSS